MDLTDFVDIIGYKGQYKINKSGDIWSSHYKKIMKPNLNKKEYYCVSLGPKKNRKTYTIHRLLALNFIPNNDETKNYVDHIDGITTNNNIKNLRWVTPTENIRNQLRDTNYICGFIRGNRNNIITYTARYPVYIDGKHTYKTKKSIHRNVVEEFVEQMKKDFPNPYTAGRLLDI
tara:strand:- start:36 stop:557 length:522 start_codon:yes stop_codon:yes gene_type:complete